jgi:multisubunit Na+/H+ antiporter MnhB subunit
MLKSVAAVVTGYVVFAVSAVLLFWATGRDPHEPQRVGFLVFSVLYGMAFATAGGFVAAKIAARKPRQHALAVAVVLAIGASASLLAQPGAGARWSQLAALIFMAPAALAGGFVRSRRT